MLRMLNVGIDMRHDKKCKNVFNEQIIYAAKSEQSPSRLVLPQAKVNLKLARAKK